MNKKPRSHRARRPLGPSIPQGVKQIAEELRDLPGVVCVVWGSRKTGKRWFHEPCISVHVRKKIHHSRLGERLLPKTIDGFRVDVLEVGDPKRHALDVTTLVDAGRLGRSTATVYATRGQNTLALLSGHGAYLDGADELNVTVTSDGETFVGTVNNGGFGGTLSVDWALATFEGNAVETNTIHPATGCSPPLPLAPSILSGDRFRNYSERRGMVEGIFQGTVVGQIQLEDEVYTSLLSIAATSSGTAFSVPGESGSLIVDTQRRAVGAVVGGRPDKQIFYAYAIQRLAGVISPAKFRLFFKEDSS